MARLLHTLVFSTFIYLAAATPSYIQPDDTRHPIHLPDNLTVKKKDVSGVMDVYSYPSAIAPCTYYASTAYCKPETVKDWTCGVNCEQNADFTVSTQGGDGVGTRYWYVGYDPALNTVIVSHQGTDPESMMTLLDSANSEMTSLNSSLFPRNQFPASMQVHKKIADEHARTIMPIYIAVVNEVVKHMDKHPTVTLLSHSQGAALALLDAVFMVSNLPDWVHLECFGYSQPRVGNQEFADYVDQKFSFMTTDNSYGRITNKKDPIPVNPPISLGYHQTSFEYHIEQDGQWAWCQGQDISDPLCSVGAVPNNSDGVLDDSYEPYGNVTIGC